MALRKSYEKTLQEIDSSSSFVEVKCTDNQFLNRYLCIMFKRLFILSGIIAFLLACAMMWFWYLPMKDRENQNETIEVSAVPADSSEVLEPDTLTR